MARRSHTHVKDVVHLIGCTAAIYLCFLSFAFVQERLYKTPHGPTNERFSFSLFLVFSQCVCNSLTAGTIKTILGGSSKVEGASPVPMKQYIMISAAYIGAMLSSNMALRFVNYPTQVLGKSCKMIPVMLMGVLINGKRYRKREYSQVFLITLGISIFMGFQPSGSKSDAIQRVEGVALLFVSLLLDGFTGPLQEQAIARHRPSVHEMMFGTNVYAIPMCLGAMFVQGTFFEAINFVRTYPDVLRDIAEFCILSALGQNFIFLTLFRFDSLVLTVIFHFYTYQKLEFLSLKQTITTTRKFFTILFSVLWFGNTVNYVQWLGVAGVFAGLGLNILSKFHDRKSKKKSL